MRLPGLDDSLQMVRQGLGATVQGSERHTRRLRLDRNALGGAARTAATEPRHRRRLLRPHRFGAHG